MNVAVLSNVNLDILIQNLIKQHNVFKTEGYGQWITYCLEKQGKMYDFLPECIIVILDGKALLEDCISMEEGKERLREYQKYVNCLSDNYSGAIIAISTIDIRMMQKTGNEADISMEWEYEWEKCVQELIAKKENIYRFELKRLVCDFGRNNFYSDKLWYTGSIPYSINAINYLTEQISIYIDRINSVRKKVLLIDLDNTIWGGVLGDAGVQGIVLGNSGIGKIYQDVQKSILKLRKKGVLLAIVSKNNLEDVLKVFKENKHMVLQKDDFVSIHANWKSKSQNIIDIADELNLGMDSFVFLDDNVLEQGEVKENLPEIEIVPFPIDISQLPAVIEKMYEKYFWCWRITQEDAEKTRLYHSEVLRRSAKAQEVSMDDYLRGLHARIELQYMCKENLERTVQLINKTNQFNTCTLRMNVIEIMEYSKDSNHRVIVADISDKFGDNGLVAVILLRKNGKSAHIDNFLMSCRVMGRKFEDAIIASILEKLEEEEIEVVTAEYIASSRNKPVAELWDKLGFETIQENNNNKLYKILTKARKIEDLHNVIWK